MGGCREGGEVGVGREGDWELMRIVVYIVSQKLLGVGPTYAYCCMFSTPETRLK